MSNLRLMFIGDSITRGVKNEPQNRFANRIVRNFQTYGHVVDARNHGAAGATSRSFVTTNPQEWVYEPINTFRPHVAVIALGTNNCNAYAGGDTSYTTTELGTGLETIADTLKAVGCRQFVFCNVAQYWNNAAYQTWATAFNGAISGRATTEGMPLVDFYTALPNDTYTLDDIHPTSAGHALYSAAIWNEIVAAGWKTNVYY